LTIPTEFDSYTVVLLRRPDDAPELSEQEEDALQEQHVAHIMSMVESGAALAAGPFTEQSDPSLRGLAIFLTGPDEARALAEEDPAVRRGRLAIEVLTWLTPAGQLNVERAGDDLG
jgi:uncharacterized protein YciI